MKILSLKGLVEKTHGQICQDDNNSVSYLKKDGAVVVPDVDYKSTTSTTIGSSTDSSTDSGSSSSGTSTSGKSAD